MNKATARKTLDELRQDAENSRCTDCGLGLDLDHSGCNDNRKSVFIKALAEYLVGDQALKSIQLGARSPAAKQWAKLRNLTPLFGSPTIEEAEKQLAKFLA